MFVKLTNTLFQFQYDRPGLYDKKMRSGPKTQIGGPYKATKCKVIITTQKGGSSKTNMLSYINSDANCATQCVYITKNTII